MKCLKHLLFFCMILPMLLPAPTALATGADTAEPPAPAAATPAVATPMPVYTPAPPRPTPFVGLIGLNATQNASSEDIVRTQIRLRDLDYFNFKPTGRFQSMTANAAKKFQQKHTMDDGSPMIADGTIGTQSMDILFRHTVARADIAADIPIGQGLSGDPAITGELVPWSEVQAMLVVGTEYAITDYNTGTTFSMCYTGGENHAEMECKDAFNAGIYKEVFGSEYNFSKRPVVISINGQNIAASLSGWPHGEDTYAANEMPGHTCLFFDGSLSHVGSLPDAEHLELVYKAAGR